MKKKLLFAAAMLLAAVGVNAQTDVTSTYLTNADFSQGTPVTVGVCTYAKDKATNGTEYANLVPVDNWTAVESADGKAGGLFAIGGGAWLGGKGFTAPATDSDGNTGVNVLGIVTCWGATVKYTQNLKQALPAGTYTLVIGAYNSGSGQNNIKSNLIGFVEAGGTTHYATTSKYNSNTWKYEFITFTLSAETEGYISLGYTGEGGSAGLPHLFLSGLTLFEGEVDAEAYEAAKAAAREAKEAKVYWDAAVAAAQAALADNDYTSVTGTDRTNLEAELAKAEPTTKDGYNEATDALNAATDAFKAAKASFDELAEINAVAAKLGLDALTAASGTEAIEKAHVQNVAVYNKVNEDFTFPVTLGSWTQTGATQENSGQHWDDGSTKYWEPNQWSSGSVDWAISQTLAGLPAGDYVLMATGRRSGDITMTMTAAGESVTTFPNADFGLGVDTSGDANFGEGTFAADGQGRGWQWRYVPFTLTEVGDVEIKVTATATSTHQWASITAFKLWGKAEAEVAIAKAELLAAINDADAANNGVNVGTGAFQIPASAVTALEGAIADAQAVYDNEGATLEEVEEAITAIIDAVSEYEAAELNAPEAGDVFNVILKAIEENYGWDDKAMTLRANDRTDAGLYNFQYTDLNENYAQNLTFTKVEGNNYTISISADAEGETRYICTGKVYGGNDYQLRTTLTEADAAQFTIIPTATEGIWNIWNIAANQYVGSQDAGVYTVDRNYNFQIVKNTAENPSVGLSLTAGKFATRIYPFKPAVANNGVKYYSCADASENELTLAEVEDPVANVPYILEATVNVNDTQTGVGAAFKETYTDGWLTGVFAEEGIEITEGYVLQTKEGKQAFYIINPEKPINVPAYRAYLTVPSSTGVKSFNLGDDTTGISALEALTNNAFEAIYSADGVKLNRIEKGVNILKMSDGTTRKVILK